MFNVFFIYKVVISRDFYFSFLSAQPVCVGGQQRQTKAVVATQTHSVYLVNDLHEEQGRRKISSQPILAMNLQKEATQNRIQSYDCRRGRLK